MAGAYKKHKKHFPLPALLKRRFLSVSYENSVETVQNPFVPFYVSTDDIRIIDIFLRTVIFKHTVL